MIIFKHSFFLLFLLISINKSFAQVLYTDIVDDTITTLEVDSLKIDLNQDGTYDFYIVPNVFSYPFAIPYMGEINYTNTVGVVSSIQNEGEEAIKAFSKNDTIRANQPYYVPVDAGKHAFISDDIYHPLDTDFYIALHLDSINTAIRKYYGWARVQFSEIENNEYQLILKDYALEASGEAIIAGSQTKIVGINKPNMQKLNIFPNPAKDYIYVPTQSNEKYNILDNTGRIIDSGYIDSINSMIYIDKLFPGIYFLSVGEYGYTQLIKQ